MKVGIVGLGNFGKAVQKLITSKGYNVSVYLKNASVYDCDLLFICVKPSNYLEVCKKINNTTTIISCGAGVSLDYLETQLTTRNIIRCMGSIPIKLNDMYSETGTIIFKKNSHISDSQVQKFKNLVKGPYMLEVQDEKLIDVSTILSGSMPAIISYFSEEFVQFGVNNGFTPDQSRELYLSTLRGTVQMLETESTQSIIEQVSSPKGVTQKCLAELNKLNVKIQKSLSSALDQLNHKKD